MTRSSAIETRPAPPTAETLAPSPVGTSESLSTPDRHAIVPTTGRERYARWTMIALLAGCLFRLLQYLGNRSIWLDEALLIPWFTDASFGEILDPLRIRPIPSGFLFLEKLSAEALGSHELVLRLVPILAGVASLFLFVAVAKRCLSGGAVPVATGLFALSPFLIYYSSEVKPYSSDVAVTLLVLLLAVAIHQQGYTRVRALAWMLATALGILVSLTSVFVTAGSALMLMLVAIRSRAWSRAAGVALASAPAGVLFALPYVAQYLRAPASTAAAGTEGPGYMASFWESGFMPLPPRTAADWLWFPHTMMRIFQDPLGLIHNDNAELGRVLAVLGIVLFAAGCAWLATRNRFVLGLLVAPVLLTLLASGLERYPFGADWNTGGRVILFLAPIFFLLMAEGVEQIRRTLPGRSSIVGLLLVALLLAPPLLQAATTVPYGRGELKPLLSYIQENWRDGDQLYVHYDALPAFRYYAPRYGFERDEYVEGVCARFRPEQYLEALSGLRGERRVWILFTAGLGAGLFNEREFMLDYLGHIGERLDDRVARGTFAYLYDLRPGAGANAPYRVRLPAIAATVEEGCALWR